MHEAMYLPRKRFIALSRHSYVSKLIFLVLWTGKGTFLVSASFDTVDPEILLHQIQTRLGIGRTAMTWIRSYLADRTQEVIINYTLSNPVHLPFGVPQGSVQGPSSFLHIYPTYSGYHQTS